MAAIRNLYHTVLTLLVLAGIVTGLIALGRGRRPVQGLFWLIVFLAVVVGTIVVAMFMPLVSIITNLR